jgi:hypothetical protein
VVIGTEMADSSVAPPYLGGFSGPVGSLSSTGMFVAEKD